uniref:beta-ketoacyl-[acyl-carrier-protein] synthase I n=1 Tax=Alexandrium andersonii TaxID=327968 RepID=A0A7S2AFT3_9DINO
MAEVRAIQRAFDHQTDGLVVNSSKSMIGHCLGAAAGVEAVITIQALRHQKVHPTLNHEDPEDGFDLKTPLEAMELPELKVAASNSFGFGGHNSCLLFRRYEG